jgi:hypothetical protein
MKKTDDNFSKGILSIIDKKFGFDIWPIGIKK